MKHSGFTLIEILIGIALVGILTASIGTLSMIVFRSFGTTGQIEDVTQAKNDIVRELSDAIRWGNDITLSGIAPEYILDIDGYLYRFGSRKATKNNIPLHSLDVLVEAGSIENYSRRPSELASIMFIIKLTHARSKQVSDIVTFVVSERRTVLKKAQ